MDGQSPAGRRRFGREGDGGGEIAVCRGERKEGRKKELAVHGLDFIVREGGGRESCLGQTTASTM